MPRRGLALLAAAALALLGITVAQSTLAPAAGADTDAVVVFDSIPQTLPQNWTSQGAQAYKMQEFGQRIQLAGTAREVSDVTVGFSNWACENWATSDPCQTTPGSTFDLEITVNLYAVGAAASVGELLGSTTQTVEVPYRPSPYGAPCAGTRWSGDGGTTCSSGIAFTADFGFATRPVVPSDLIVGVVYNTQSAGPVPTGVKGPYNSFNIGLEGVVSTGAVADSDHSVYVDSDNAKWYTATETGADIDASWVNTFHHGAHWDPYAPIPIRITAVEAPTPIPTLHVDPYFTAGALYKGIGVDVKATNVTDATEVRVTVHRLVGGDVVKVSKASGNVLATVNAGNAVTAPIVIQPGTYNEAGSGSWLAYATTWTPETLPIGVTVEILRGDEVIVEQTLESIGTTLATLDEVIPAMPRFTNPTATFHNADNYKGIAVDIRVDSLRDAEQVLVQVNRADGQPVVKKSQWAAAQALNTGQPKSLTVPIVIQPGTYNEATSASWLKPIAVWTPSSMPTSVVVTIKRTYGPDLVITLHIGGSSAGVLPTTTPTAPIVIEVPTSGGAYEVEVPAEAEDVNLNLGTPDVVSGGVTIPVEVAVTTTVGVNVTFQPNTTVTSTDPAWDGVIELPKVKTDVVVPAASGQTTTVGVALQMGSSTARIDFDNPVKLVLAGQAGKLAGYIESSASGPGAFHAITTACPAVMPDDMTTDECWVNDGGDLVIWTTHFTTFVSYDSVATPTPGGGGGGGGTGSGTATSSGSSGTTTSTGSALVPTTVKAATPKPTPTATPSPRPTSTPDAPEAAIDPAVTVAQDGGGFDPVLLIVIVITVAVLGAGVATVVTLRRRARG